MLLLFMICRGTRLFRLIRVLLLLLVLMVSSILLYHDNLLLVYMDTLFLIIIFHILSILQILTATPLSDTSSITRGSTPGSAAAGGDTLPEDGEAAGCC